VPVAALSWPRCRRTGSSGLQQHTYSSVRFMPEIQAKAGLATIHPGSGVMVRRTFSRLPAFLIRKSMNLQSSKAIQWALTGIMLFLSACQNDPVTPAANNSPQVRPLTSQETKTVSSANDFAFRAFAAIRAGEETNNIFISPLSISSALTMTYNGANGATREAMQQVLGFAPQTPVF
jgi:hypothetical protein